MYVTLCFGPTVLYEKSTSTKISAFACLLSPSKAEAAKELFYNSSSKGPLTDPAGLEFLQKRYDEAYRQLAETEKEIKRREDGKKNFEMVIDQLRNSEDQIQDYSKPLFNSLIEKMTVYSKSRVVVTFRCGTEIELGL